MPKLETIQREKLLPPPSPMRARMDEQALEDLAGSIKLQGILIPLLVTPVWVAADENTPIHEVADLGQGPVYAARYEIIDGHRRYIASAMVGLHELLCLVFDKVGDAKLCMMHTANLQREDVTPAEEGLHYLEMVDRLGWGIDQLCRFFRKSESYINERTDLWRKDPLVAEAVKDRKIGFGVAQQLNRISDEVQRHYVLDLACTHGMTVQAARVYFQNWQKEAALRGVGPAPHTPEHYRPTEPEGRPVCTWCNRDDDQTNMVMVPVHAYHKKDLCLFLEKSGLNRPQRESS